MMPAITEYIAAYGYFAIFFIVLLQEMGMPGLPNELLLFSFGYLAKQAGLSYPLVVGLVMLADIAGAFFLFLLFYYGRYFFPVIKPRPFKFLYKKIEKVKRKLLLCSGRAIFIARLTPFARSYIPVAAGLIQVKPWMYVRIVLCTALIWSGGLVTAGWLIHF